MFIKYILKKKICCTKNEYKDPKISHVIPSKTPFLPPFSRLSIIILSRQREEENEGIHYNTPPSLSPKHFREQKCVCLAPLV